MVGGGVRVVVMVKSKTILTTLALVTNECGNSIL